MGKMVRLYRKQIPTCWSVCEETEFINRKRLDARVCNLLDVHESNALCKPKTLLASLLCVLAQNWEGSKPIIGFFFFLQ